MSEFRRSGTSHSSTSVYSTGGGIARTSTSASSQSNSQRPSTSTSSSPASQYPTQIISDRYLDPDKLKEFLDREFPGRYKAQMKLGKWLVQTPRPISEDELDKMCS